jgi:hypothetical protein
MKTSAHLPLILLILISNWHSLIAEDVVELTNGTKLNGTILQEDDRRILLKINYGTVGFSRSQIKSITKVSDPEPLPPVAAKPDQLPSWSTIVTPLSKLPWARDLTQIPATVIDVGVMKNVPYISFRCSRDYEINIYGDLDSPVCIEVGIYRTLLDDPTAKQNCIDLLKNHVLRNALDRAIISGLDRSGDVATHGKKTVEITPPTAADAYGGWWVAVYFLDAVDAIRAKESDLAVITVPRSAKSSTPSSQDATLAWSNDDLTRSRPPASTNGDGTTAVPTASSGGFSSGGRVYVRSYTRKDGTYVHSHTRSR